MSDLDVFETRFAAAYRRYLDEVPTDVDAVAVTRAVAAARPAVGPWALRPTRALVWLVLLGLLLVALGAAALLVGSQRPTLHRDVPLVPTGIDVLTGETASYGRVVADGTGILWAREDGGRLVRYDPATGQGRSWTISNDAAFGMTDIAPARAGGVWLLSGNTLRRFDGTVFREVLDAPAEVTLVAEARDGSLWAGTSDGAVLHWNGSSWSRLEPGRPNSDAAINAIAVDTAGRTWIGWLQYPTPPGTGWVSRYDGSGWTTFDGRDAAPLAGAVWSIAQLADGAIWVATSGGLARFDGSSWTDETAQPSGDRTTSSVAAGPDGVIWVAEGATSDAAITIRRFDGRSWIAYGPSDGLPANGGYYTAWVVPTKDGVYVGTGDGLYELTDSRWSRAWPPDSSPTNLGILLALSRDELWASGDGGLWHFVKDAWTNETIDPSRPTDAPAVMALAPDGTLWAASEAGVAYRRDGRWTVVDTGAASAMAFDATGTVWVAGSATWRGSAGPELWTLRFDGTAWVKQPVEGCPLQSLGLPVRSLAFDATGVLWVGIRHGYEPGGLARFDGRNWETIRAIGSTDIDGAAVLGTASNGDIWVAATYPFVPSPAQPSQTSPDPIRAARFDGRSWTVVGMPDDRGLDPRLAPDGSLWQSTRRGPARFDGQRWTFPYAGIASPWTGVDSVAPDGTVFGWIGSSLLRFPAPAASP